MWAQITLGATAAVTENTGGLGYSIQLPGNLTTGQINAFLMSLGRIRPAGVPFTYAQAQIGLYLDTINYLDVSEVIGQYLTGAATPVPPNLPAITNSTQPLLPEYYFDDPTLNPSLAP